MGYFHGLYVITKDDKIYYTEIFNEYDLLNCELMYVCDLYNSTENFCIDSLYDGSRREYLFDLLNDDGKVDFEDYKEDRYTTIDAEKITLYKNENGTLKKLVSDNNRNSMPAIKYTLAVFCININNYWR